LKNLFVPTFDSIGLESKLGFKPAPHAERAGHSSWRSPKGIFNRLITPMALASMSLTVMAEPEVAHLSGSHAP
jgi:hypothetical protein